MKTETILEKIGELTGPVYRENEYPALAHQCRQWARTRPLAGLEVLDATPVFRNTLLKYAALLNAGASLSVGISSVMARDGNIVRFLHSAGIPVFEAATPNRRDFDLILDCAASFARWNARRGYVELTRSGTDRYRQSGKTVYLADSGRIKRIETSLGTGESYFRAMAQLGYTEWAGRRIVVFGSGKVGSGIVFHARIRGARVSVVTDPATLTARIREDAERTIDFRDREAVGKAVLNAYAVVTATGVAGAVGSCCPAESLLASEALLANMGVEDEFGPDIPPERVLNGKKTLNFILEEPTHLKYIDATMALHNAGALRVAEHPGPGGIILPARADEDELLDLSRRNGIVGEEIGSIL